MAILISTTVDPEDLIDQYNWLCNTQDWLRETINHESPEAVGLQNLLESLMMGLWGSTAIYVNEDGVYLVIMPDTTTTYQMQCNEHGTFFAAIEGPPEGDLDWHRVNNEGDRVPIGFPKEVSIMSVEPVIREKILKYISEDQEYYDQYLEPTT